MGAHPTRLEQDAADTLAWHERQERHKAGYGPMKPAPPLPTWKPTLTEQQKAEFEKYAAEHQLPF